MANNPKNQDNNDDNVQGVPLQQKELICTAIFGKVKWFNVKRGYGFVCRNDNQEDVFIHQSAIVKSNPDHPRKSVGDGEDIQFDIVKGAKGNEAANVCGADGNCVRGSEYALRYQRGGRFRGGRGGRGRGAGGRSRGHSEEQEHPQEFVRGGGPPRGGGRGYRGPARPYMVQYRKPQFPGGYDMPPPPPPASYYYEYDYYGGNGGGMPLRGRGGGRGGFRGPPVYRGGPPPPPHRNYGAYEYDGYERRAPRGRGRFRQSRGGRSFGRGGRGESRVIIKDEGEEPQQPHREEEHRFD